MQLWQGKRAMASGWTRVRLKSKRLSAVRVSRVLTPVNRELVVSWAKGDAGREIQRRVWESLSTKLNIIQPGCV